MMFSKKKILALATAGLMTVSCFGGFVGCGKDDGGNKPPVDNTPVAGIEVAKDKMIARYSFNGTATAINPVTGEAIADLDLTTANTFTYGEKGADGSACVTAREGAFLMPAYSKVADSGISLSFYYKADSADWNEIVNDGELSLTAANITTKSFAGIAYPSMSGTVLGPAAYPEDKCATGTFSATAAWNAYTTNSNSTMSDLMAEQNKTQPWMYVTFTVTNDGVKMYKNGALAYDYSGVAKVKELSPDFVSNAATEGLTFLGAVYGSIATEVDDLIVSQALTDDEVDQLFAAVKVDGIEKTKNKIGPHKWDAGVDLKANCIKNSRVKFVCTVCNTEVEVEYADLKVENEYREELLTEEQYAEKFVAAFGHDYEVTTTNDGYHRATCKTCDGKLENGKLNNGYGEVYYMYTEKADQVQTIGDINNFNIGFWTANTTVNGLEIAKGETGKYEVEYMVVNAGGGLPVYKSAYQVVYIDGVNEEGAPTRIEQGVIRTDVFGWNTAGTVEVKSTSPEDKQPTESDWQDTFAFGVVVKLTVEKKIVEVDVPAVGKEGEEGYVAAHKENVAQVILTYEFKTWKEGDDYDYSIFNKVATVTCSGEDKVTIDMGVEGSHAVITSVKKVA